MARIFYVFFAFILFCSFQNSTKKEIKVEDYKFVNEKCDIQLSWDWSARMVVATFLQDEDGNGEYEKKIFVDKDVTNNSTIDIEKLEVGFYRFILTGITGDKPIWGQLDLEIKKSKIKTK